MIESDPEPDGQPKGQAVSDKMKIAFRYQNLPTNSVDYSESKHISHHFDLSRNISFSDIENSDIVYWAGQRIDTSK